MKRITFYEEEMNEDELSFLHKKEAKESKQFYKVANLLMIFSFVVPFVFAWFRAVEDKENEYEIAFTTSNYFIGVASFLIISAIIMVLVYFRFLYKLQKDIKKRTKTVEHTHIKRKQYMPHNKTYYVYLDSPSRLSIEVSEDDYVNMREGDELNIEYTSIYKFYLGYF